MSANADWVQWGEEDPFYGVATFGEGREKGGAHAWTAGDLYASGQRDWELVRAKWDAYGRKTGTVAEIGCGVGRYSRAMAADFQEVIGFDVSPGMLSRAEEFVDLPNVRFRLADGVSIPLDGSSCDAVFSVFVLQHLDSDSNGMHYLRESARVLRPGGTLFIHLPLHSFPAFSQRLNPVFRMQYGLVKAVRLWQAKRKRTRTNASQRPLTFRLISYETDKVLETLRNAGMVQPEVVMFTLPSNPEEWVTAVMATKA